MKLSIKKVLREGEPAPIYYGIAWFSYDTLTLTAYPIPLNIILGGLRKLLMKLRQPKMTYETGYDRGYIKGEGEGREYAFHQYKVQALQGEIRQIIDNFLSVENEVFKLIREDKDKANGWILKFIDDETNRIKESH